MRVLLTTLNARFSHSSLALRYLRGVLRQLPEIELELKEFTINQPAEDILCAIFQGSYDCVCFSTYIWNVEMILRTAENLKKVAPDMRILLGGPEVSYDQQSFLNAHAFIDGIIIGEGEETLRKVFTAGFETQEHLNIPGTAWNTTEGFCGNPSAMLITELDSIPFPYDESDSFANRLVYYESSRGCPYKCTYCLSSASEGVRYFSLERVYSDLKWLLSKKIQTIKFVDRTFNVKQEHALGILDFIEVNDNGVTCFHFEISAGILTEDIINRCAGLRKGLVQFEIGVQSTCPEALKASGRPDWTDRIEKNVAILKVPGNIHLHLDLIAGLPNEGYKRFLESFDSVYKMKPDMLQLGFLKLIRGTAMRSKAEEYGMAWREEPPYEVLYTKWITYGELCMLKHLEALLDLYGQHGRFAKTLSQLEKLFQKPSALFIALEGWWHSKGHWDRNIGQDEAWLLMYDFALSTGVPEKILKACMRWDAIVNYKPKAFVGTVLQSHEPEKGLQHSLLHDRENEDSHWAAYRDIPVKQLLKTLHFEIFPWDPESLCNLTEPVILCFDTSHSPSKVVFRWYESEIINKN